MSEVDFLVGETVTEIQYDNRIVFVAGGKPEPTVYADVNAWEVTDAAGQSQPLASLVSRTVVATSTSDGVLALEFTGGFTLRSGPDPQFEAWQVVGGHPQYLVVCLPGGEIAVWDRRDKP